MMTHINNNNNRRLVTLAEHTSDSYARIYIYLFAPHEDTTLTCEDMGNV